MSTVKRIARNTFFLFASKAISKILALILAILIARGLGVEGFGLYAFVLAFAAVFNLSKLGMNNLLLRETARNRQRKSVLLGNVIVLKALAGVFSLLIVGLAIFLLGYEAEIIWLVLLATLALVLESFASSFNILFQAFERMEFTLVVNTVCKVIVLVLSLYALFAGFGVQGIILALLAANILHLIISLALALSKFVLPVFKLSFQSLKNVFSCSLPFFFQGLFVVIFNNIDTVMIQFFQGNLEAGLYSSAYKLILALSFLVTPFIASIYPVMLRSQAQALKSTSLMIERSLKYVAIIMVPAAFGTSVLAREIMVLFFGREFSPAGLCLSILVWFTLFASLNMVLSRTFYVLNREKLSATIMAVCVVINVILNLILIPVYSFVAASFTTLFVGVAYFITANLFLPKYAFKISFKKILPKPFLAALLMALLVMVLKGVLSLFLVVPLAALVYFALLVLFRAFDETDKKMLFKIMGRS